MLLPSPDHVDNQTVHDHNLNLSDIAAQGRILENTRIQIENSIHESYNRITHYQIGYGAQLNKLQFKWNKFSENQQSLSVLMKQLKNIQSIWKLQLNINLEINKLSKSFGFTQTRNNDDDHKRNRKPSLQMFKICVKIIRDIHNMTQQCSHCMVDIEITQKTNASSIALLPSLENTNYVQKPRSNGEKSSLNDIIHELHHEIKLYSNIIVEIVQFAFDSIVTMKPFCIEIQSMSYLKRILKSMDKMDRNACIAFIHSLLCEHIFDLLFDSSSSLFALHIEAKQRKLEISRKCIEKTGTNTNNLLCANVIALIQVIEWIESNLFINDVPLCNHWKQKYVFPVMDEWIILWINLNTPILSHLICTEHETKDNEHIHSAIEHIHCSISYQQNIENALKSLQEMMEKTKHGLSGIYLKESLELLANDTDDEYGLSSKILSSVLPSKIREYIYDSIRNKIKHHDYECFDPSNLHIPNTDDDDDDSDDTNKLITYGDLMRNSESFFRNEPCKISKTMFEIAIIIYNICIFIEQMYYIVDETQNDIICLSTMYVDLFMDICRDIVQLWMSLSVSYHKKYFSDVSYIGFQFYNDCSFLSYHLCLLSIITNHGNLLITDNMRQMMSDKQVSKYLWFTDYLEPLKSLGKQYFIHHLHNQRKTILKSLEIIRRFKNIKYPKRYQDIKQSFDESLVSISQFLNGCRSIIPDSLLYQIGGKLLECVCNEVVEQLMSRLDCSESSDIGIAAAHNISLLIKHIQAFELLSNDLEYMTRNMKVWKKFVKLADILDEEQSLSVLTQELNQDTLNVFDGITLIKLITALFQESEKRSTFIHNVESKLK